MNISDVRRSVLRAKYSADKGQIKTYFWMPLSGCPVTVTNEHHSFSIDDIIRNNKRVNSIQSQSSLEILKNESGKLFLSVIIRNIMFIRAISVKK